MKRFNSWVDNSKLKKIRGYCRSIVGSKGTISEGDVYSKLCEQLVDLNPHIEIEEQFFNGLIITKIRWIIGQLSEQRKNTKYESQVAIAIEDNFSEFQEIAHAREELLAPVINSHYHEFYIDRFIHDIDTKDLAIKYNISVKGVDKRIKTIKQMLKGKKNNREYKGIARICLKSGKIEKAYPDYKHIEDIYERTAVSKCCNNKIKSHAGYKWAFIKTLINETNSQTN